MPRRYEMDVMTCCLIISLISRNLDWCTSQFIPIQCVDTIYKLLADGKFVMRVRVRGGTENSDNGGSFAALSLMNALDPRRLSRSFKVMMRDAGQFFSSTTTKPGHPEPRRRPRQPLLCTLPQLITVRSIHKRHRESQTPPACSRPLAEIHGIPSLPPFSGSGADRGTI